MNTHLLSMVISDLCYQITKDFHFHPEYKGENFNWKSERVFSFFANRAIFDYENNLKGLIAECGGAEYDDVLMLIDHYIKQYTEFFYKQENK